MTLVELCVEDLAGVEIAREYGAERVELCTDLWCGGLTPPLALVEEALRRAPAGGLQVLVRQQADSFVLGREEVESMCRAMAAFLNLEQPVPLGFVVGAVTEGGSIDREAAARLRQAAGSAPLTFHRAFDTVADQARALEELVELGYDRILTTGGDPAVADPAALRALSILAAGRLVILGSGGLRAANVRQVAEAAALTEVHLRAPGPRGGTSAGEVRAVMEALRR